MERTLSHLIAGYLIAVGLLFGFSSVFGSLFIEVQPEGKFYVFGISVVFVLAGIASLFLLRKGMLKKQGSSISQVRQEAVEKMKDPELLSRIALEESEEELKEAAKERLKEVKGTK